MIGGFDQTFGGRPDAGERALILRGLRARWPDALVEDADTAVAHPIAASPPAWPPGEEFLVYRDAASRASWGRLGASPENDDALIHVFVCNDGMTFVIHRRGGDAERIVSELATDITSRRLSFGAAYYRERHAA